MTTRLFVLDTNVLMHDPSALFRFQEHDIFLPMVVLEELDNGKKGLSEVSRNVRQVSRYIDQLVSGKGEAEIAGGLPLSELHGVEQGDMASGRIFFQTDLLDADLPRMLPGNKPDNTILNTAIALQDLHPERHITLVSKDINLRIKAAVVGVEAEDYRNDRVLDDLDLLHTGYTDLPASFWEGDREQLKSWTDEVGRTFYEVQGEAVKDLHVGQFVHVGEDDTAVELVVRELRGGRAKMELIKDFGEGRTAVWGVHARNREQNYALNLLMDPDIEFVTLLGAAGTGKTLLTLAAALAQVLDEPRYREIIMTRVTVPVGEDIGFLPGTEEEKMTPWMGALMDNLEVLTGTLDSGDWERAATNELLAKRIKIRSLNFMRGRTFLNRFLILDEAQNLTSKQLKTLITRAGPGTKIVCLGNLAQIDTPYLTETTSGLTFVVDRFRDWEHGGHVTLARGERSRLADFASNNL